MSPTHSSDVCADIQGALIAFFIFPHPGPICFVSFLFALDRLKASVCIPEQLRDASANKEDDCPCSLKKGQPSLEVFYRNTFKLLVRWRRPFIPHPRGGQKSAIEGF